MEYLSEAQITTSYQVVLLNRLRIAVNVINLSITVCKLFEMFTSTITFTTISTQTTTITITTTTTIISTTITNLLLLLDYYYDCYDHIVIYCHGEKILC